MQTNPEGLPREEYIKYWHSHLDNDIGFIAEAVHNLLCYDHRYQYVTFHALILALEEGFAINDVEQTEERPMPDGAILDAVYGKSPLHHATVSIHKADCWAGMIIDGMRNIQRVYAELVNLNAKPRPDYILLMRPNLFEQGYRLVLYINRNPRIRLEKEEPMSIGYGDDNDEDFLCLR